MKTIEGGQFYLSERGSEVLAVAATFIAALGWWFLIRQYLTVSDAIAGEPEVRYPRPRGPGGLAAGPV